MKQKWRGVLELRGAAAIAGASFPIIIGSSDGSQEVIHASIQAPNEERGPLDSVLYHQRIEIEIVDEETNVVETAREFGNSLADFVAFTTGRRLQVVVEPLTSIDEGGSGKTLLPMVRMPRQQSPLIVNVNFLQRIWAQLGDFNSDRSRRIMRALRWLRRSASAADEVEEFTALAIGLESLVAVLPHPPEIEGKKKDKPGGAEKLRYYATQFGGVTEEQWKHAGTQRHALFHGGITESRETKASLLVATPAVRRVLVSALRELLEVTSDEAPSFASEGFVIPYVLLSGPLFTPSKPRENP